MCVYAATLTDVVGISLRSLLHLLVSEQHFKEVPVPGDVPKHQVPVPGDVPKQSSGTGQGFAHISSKSCPICGQIRISILVTSGSGYCNIQLRVSSQCRMSEPLKPAQLRSLHKLLSGYAQTSASEAVMAKVPEILADIQANLQVEPSPVALLPESSPADPDELIVTV